MIQASALGTVGPAVGVGTGVGQGVGAAHVGAGGIVGGSEVGGGADVGVGVAVAAQAATRIINVASAEIINNIFIRCIFVLLKTIFDLDSVFQRDTSFTFLL